MKIKTENYGCEPLKSEELQQIEGGGILKNLFHVIGQAIAEYDNRFAIDLSALAGGNQDRY